jgi:4-amino-4-deoxyprephenate dehydrogenase
MTRKLEDSHHDGTRIGKSTMLTSSSLLRSAVVIGGSGAVGLMLAEAIASCGTRVTIVDKAASSAGFPTLETDALHPSPELRDVLTDADVVILALPEDVACRSVAPVAAAMRRDALMVDTLSVKGAVVPLLEASSVAEAVSINPMFHPSLGMRGRPIVVVPVRTSRRAEAFLDVLTAGQARLTEMSGHEHDRLMAAAQVATHAAILAVGASLRALGADVATLCAVAPPPHMTMLALVARVCTGEAAVYRDIQTANPAAQAARAALITSLTQLDSLVTDGTSAEFARYLDDIRAHLGTNADALARHCAELSHTPLPRVRTED